jgi:hypothetical protein
MPTPPLGTDALARAFSQQEMELVDQVGVEAAAGATRTRALPGNLALDLNVPLAAQEDAAILLEQDGLYTWHFATETETAASLAPGTVRGVTAAPLRQARFRIALSSEPAGPALQRGVVGDFIRGKVQAFIFRFAARVVVGQAMKFLERKVRRGLVRVDGPDSAAWDLLGATPLALPTTRPARILLLIHGTFSSTVGAYAALTATPWGREFLAAAHANYDAVLGFDHATLSEDPLENATELLAALQGLSWAHPPRFDVVAHSRGGLVLRSLLEHLLPLTAFEMKTERVIFVGVTNGGTLLAEPANWQALVDLYTNLALGATHLLGLLPPAKVLATVLEELVRGLGAFVKYCATTAVTDRLVPGLAAMAPSGDFVRRLNEEQVRQPSVEQSYYCAVTSEFRPRVLGGEHEPRELPARLLEWLGSGFMQALMREANDLVVHTVAMTQIDPGVGNYLKDTLAFGPNPQVYHTNYFVQPRVINALTRWLQLAAPAARTAASPSAEGGRPRRAVAGAATSANARRTLRRPAVAAPGSFVEAPLPADVDLDVYVTTADVSVADAVAAVRAAHPSYVVVRHFAGGVPQDYAFSAEDLLKQTRRRPQQATLHAALRLATTPPSAVHTPGAGPANPGAEASVPAPADPAVPPAAGGEHDTSTPPGLAAPAAPAVVLRQGRPAGVLPAPAALPDGLALADLVRKVAHPRRDEEFILRRRAMPTFGGSMLGSLAPLMPLFAFPKDIDSVVAASPGVPEVRPRRAGTGTPPQAAKVTCHFRAEMDQQVEVGRPTALEVVVSREALDRALHGAAATDSRAVAPDAPLLVEVLPKVNFEYVESMASYRKELAPPAPGETPALYFMLRATHTGEGEVWVLVRQGQVPVLTLCLRPQVVSGREAGAARRVQVEATAAALPPPTAAVHQLIITERRNGTQLSYHFQLQLPGLGVLQWGETSPFVGDRQAYVANLYQEIENRWLGNQADSENFTAELRALGGALFDDLIPADLQRLLWQHRRAITSILVIAEEPFIPWELVHLHAPGKPLGRETCSLGQLGLVRWLHEAGWPREQLYLRPGKSRYVIPHYPHPDYELPEAEAEEDFLRDVLEAKAVAPNARAVRTLLGRAGAFDLLHFACHGEANHDNIANAQLLLEGRVEGGSYLPEYFSATTAEQYANFGKHAPIVVLNACQAGRTGYRLTGVGGFAQSFLRRGAGAFVGTLWAVGDKPARTFTEALYRHLLDGDTLAEATTAAREQARQAGDATWLAYAVYGHPYAKVVR